MLLMLLMLMMVKIEDDVERGVEDEREQSETLERVHDAPQHHHRHRRRERNDIQLQLKQRSKTVTLEWNGVTIVDARA